jgi:hypothetical protein
MLTADPRCAEFEAWLTSLPARTEFVYRMTLRGLSEHCRGDRAWRARVEALCDRYGDTTARLAGVMRDAAKASDRIMGGLSS